MTISIKKSERKFPERVTSLRARMVKNLIFLSAQTTANVKNRQERVFRSKYPKYCLSGGTKNAVIKAANAAMQNTIFFFINLKAFKLAPSSIQIFATLILYYKWKVMSILK